MGVYDFLRGGCPNPACQGKVDHHPNYGVAGDIQTKLWAIPEQGMCFRSFCPGDTVPKDMGQVVIPIGKTCCCSTEIEAVFDGTTLLGYKLLDQPFDQKLYPKSQ